LGGAYRQITLYLIGGTDDVANLEFKQCDALS
jgi:hypothetical protein